MLSDPPSPAYADTGPPSAPRVIASHGLTMRPLSASLTKQATIPLLAQTTTFPAAIAGAPHTLESTILTSDHTMFPHEKRAKGHTYEGKAYPADLHYRDSTVAIFVPKGFRAGDATDLVFYFHGWRNNVDDTFAKFRVAEQLAASSLPRR